MQNLELKKVIQNDPSLIWYAQNTSNLSDKSILEHVLNYGTWEQVQKAIGALGLKKTIELYNALTNKPRSNIKPRVKHYFDLYFSHVSKSTN